MTPGQVGATRGPVDFVVPRSRAGKPGSVGSVRVLLGAAVAVVALTAGCTSAAEEPAEPPKTPAVDADETLPDSCDGLLSPLTVARVLEAELAGGRSARYLAPTPQDGLVDGMICEYGVAADGAALTVSARAYEDERAARVQHRRMTTPGALGDASAVVDALDALGMRGTAVDSSAGSAYYVRDGQLTISVAISAGEVPVDSARDFLVDIASTVIHGLEAGRGTGQ